VCRQHPVQAAQDDERPVGKRGERVATGHGARTRHLRHPVDQDRGHQQHRGIRQNQSEVRRSRTDRQRQPRERRTDGEPDIESTALIGERLYAFLRRQRLQRVDVLGRAGRQLDQAEHADQPHERREAADQRVREEQGGLQQPGDDPRTPSAEPVDDRPERHGEHKGQCAGDRQPDADLSRRQP
jgi:hypothetical protein